MVFVMSRTTKFVKHEARCFATWFCSPRRLVQSKNEILSPSAKRLLRLLTLWTPSDYPYLVEVLHRRPFSRRTSPKTTLQGQTAG